MSDHLAKLTIIAVPLACLAIGLTMWLHGGDAQQAAEYLAKLIGVQR